MSLTRLSAAGIANSILYFVSFLTTIPAITMPTKIWLKISGGLVTITAVVSLVLGLDVWILTLKTKEDFAPLWSAQNSTVQDLMQTAVR